MGSYRYLPAGQTVAALVFVWALVMIAANWLNPYAVGVVISMLLWMYVCSAWNLVGGFAGQICFGHSAFYGIGAYSSTYLASAYGLSPWLGMLVGGVLSAAAAFAMGYVPFRRSMSMLVFALVTLAASLALQFLVNGIPALGGSNGLFTPAIGSSIWDMRFDDSTSFVFLIGAMLTILLLLTDRLLRSRVGLLWNAVRENELAAASIGIDIYWVKQGAFALSAFFTALAGSFSAQHLGFIDPHSVFGLEITVYVLLFAVVGGAGTLWGPLLGASILVVAGEFLRVSFTGAASIGIYNLVFGVVLMAAILLFPKGLVHALSRLRRGPVGAASDIAAPVSAHDVSPDSRTAQPDKVIVKVAGIGKSFGGLQALDDISFSIREGEILGIIGPNGAGKTTFFSILAGFQPPSAGQIFLHGRLISGLRPHEICALGIARTFQVAQSFPSLTARDVVLTAARVSCREEEAARIAQFVLGEVGLTARQDIVSSSLTLADQRRLEIARALATRPSIILLDEVMAGLTPKEVLESIELIRRIRQRGVTVVIVEHLVRAVMNLSDRIVVLDSGELIKVGTPHEVANDHRVIEAYLGRKGRGAQRSTAAPVGMVESAR